jgi:hypothetical protein
MDGTGIDHSIVGDSTGDDRILGFPLGTQGLTNQKFALLGLIANALQAGRAIRLPLIGQYDARQIRIASSLPFEEVFDLDAFLAFAHDVGLVVKRDGRFSDNVKFNPMFAEGSWRARARWLVPDSLPERYWAAMRPAPALQRVVEAARRQVFAAPVPHVTLQFRVEADFQAYVPMRYGRRGTDDITTCPSRILEKLARRFGSSISQVYVCCDAAALSDSPAAIAAEALECYGYQLVWQSDIEHGLQPQDFALRSLLDFEIAAASDVFIGTSRSTFANMVCHHAIARRGAGASRHFVYNALSDRVIERHDGGRCACPADAVAFAPPPPPAGSPESAVTRP